MGFRVGDQCPECGTVISSARRSNHSAHLILAARITAIIGVSLTLMSLLCIITPIWFITIPVLFCILLTSFLFAFFARMSLIDEQCYDDRAQDELRLAFWSLPVYFIIVSLFLFADLLIAITNGVL